MDLQGTTIAPYDQVNRTAYVSLPTEQMRAVRWRSILIGLLAIGLIVLAINLALVFLLQTPEMARRAYSLLPIKWGLLNTLDAPVDRLILGDSSGNQALIPSLISADRGGETVNLAVFGDMGLVNDDWMLETYIARHGAPSEIIVMHVYDVLYRDQPDLEKMIDMPLPFGFWGMAEPRLAYSLREQAGYLYARYFPIYTRQATLSAIINSYLAPPANPLIFEADGYTRLNEPDPAFVERDIGLHQAFVRENTFTISDINRQAIERLAQLSEEHGIRVYYALSPLVDTLYDDAGFRTYYTEAAAWLADFSAQTTTFCFLPAVRLYSATQMQSADHLIYEAAIDYTEQFVQDMQTCD